MPVTTVLNVIMHPIEIKSRKLQQAQATHREGEAENNQPAHLLNLKI